jgi:hypothetical protein
MALEFDRLGHEVLVLESGGAEPDSRSTEDSRAIIVNPQTHAPMEIAVCRTFGGTSWAWGGRCVPFDDIDFVERDHVPYSTWPINHGEIKPWHAKAAEYLLCGNDKFEGQPAKLPSSNATLSITCLERWATEPRIALIHRERIDQSELITLCLNSTVVDLDLGRDGHSVEGIVVAKPDGSKTTVRARNVVLAMGGVETTRLLLAIQQRWKDHFGGVDGPLGRYYMGHISGKIANIVFNKPEYAAGLDFEKDATESFTRKRFTLTAEAQLQHRLMNTAFWPDNPPFCDPTHRSGVLSSVFLALSFPPLGRRLVSEGIRLAHIGSRPRHYAAHLKNAILGVPGGARDIVNILRERFLSKPRKPGFLVRNKAGKYALHYHAEQEPNPESRILLSNETDRFGMPRTIIDFRFTNNDVNSVIASHQVLDTALQASGIGRLEYRYSLDELPERVRTQAADGYHQAGSTRMGHDAKSSVVDADLKVHGVGNLYIASSSVFPTTGQANSTFPAVALGLRLAHHLVQIADQCSEKTGDKSANAL